MESTQDRDASVTAEYVKAEVLAKLLFTMPENDPALRATKAVADYYSLHRNLRFDFINGKPKKAVEHLVSVIRPATLKTLIESKLEMISPISRRTSWSSLRTWRRWLLYTTSTVMLWNIRRLMTLA
jgi:hypothetical protein